MKKDYMIITLKLNIDWFFGRFSSRLKIFYLNRVVNIVSEWAARFVPERLWLLRRLYRDETVKHGLVFIRYLYRKCPSQQTKGTEDLI